ncbi:type II toxin-antitoxin system VapC family toxin [Synechocystis sp. PCC 6714]|uniref:type II toxin-antitoxin system VapC family toxin n=1 Tax=Synechocystis sp. (strain PCC 6714) TaxID=1147 RepID=UPI0004D0CEAB|nr:type II toxin-antitoxin system VapC family toxin [Synechocystis sp. PCC 6714]AIE76251.1 VapC toxin protein [Synechocystis sp. PCC 6714]
MKGWLLDTNVISELCKKNCNPAVKAWADRQSPTSFYISTITMAEIRFGIERTEDKVFRQELNQWLDQVLRPWFGDRLLGVNEDVILQWRWLVEKGRKQNYTFSQPDLFIAAIAVVHDLCVVTRNVGDFEKSGVPVFNPFLFSQ